MKLAVTVHVFTSTRYSRKGFFVFVFVFLHVQNELAEPKEQISLYVSTFLLIFHTATKNEFTTVI